MNALSTLNRFSLGDINASRNSTRNSSTNLVRSVEDTVKNLVELRNRGDLHVLLETYLPKAKSLKSFFSKYPSAWGDFLNKLNKHRKTKPDDSRSLYIDETNIADIMETLLIRGRPEDTGKKLQEELRASLYNPSLIAFASRQVSILDGSGYSFSKLKKKPRGEAIEKLIISGLTNNIDDCKEKDCPKYFTSVFPRLLHYLGKVFGLELGPLEHIKDIKECTRVLNRMFDDPEKVEDAWMVIQSFFAWPRVLEIEELCRNAKKNIGEMEIALKKAGIKIENVIIEDHITGAVIYHADLHIKGKVYKIDWRVKTPESILQKMWQKKQYNNVDAMRDIIGMNIIYPNATSDAEKKELITVFSNLMPDFGYVLKNKGAVSDSGWLTENLTKNPIAINETKSKMTDENFTNMSLSGFMKLGNTPYGAEIQFISESEAENKKKEDPYYKLRGLLDAFFRGPKYRQPSALYKLIANRVGVPYLESLGHETFGDLFWDLISKGYLIAYKSPNTKHFFFSIKGREDAIQAIFPDAKPIQVGIAIGYLVEDLRSYVRSDFRMMNNDELTKSQTFWQPPLLDQ
ncbi:MAG: hypothetical protein HHAS10_03110 [Candidatus Altimarinota bacterium]